MVNIGAVLDGLMACRAVKQYRTLSIYVKGLCYVQNMKEVGACV